MQALGSGFRAGFSKIVSVGGRVVGRRPPAAGAKVLPDAAEAAARGADDAAVAAAEAAAKAKSFSPEALAKAGFDAKQMKALPGMATDAGAANRATTLASIRAMMKGATPAQKQILQQALKNMEAKRGGYGLLFYPNGSPKIGNMFKIAGATGLAGVVAWMTFRGLGGVPGSEQLGEIVDEADPNAGGLLDMGSPQFAWMSICACCCLCCVCLVLLIVAMSA